MIRIFKTVETTIQAIETFEKGCWIHVTSPTSEELHHISEALQIPMNFLTDPLDTNERSRIEVDERNVLIVVRIPLFNNEQDVAFTTLPVGIIYLDDVFLTVCAQDVEFFDKFMKGRVKNFSTQYRCRFILQIFLKAALRYLTYLKEIDTRAANIQAELHQAMKNQELIQLLNLEKSLVFFTTSLRSNELMIERLQKVSIIKFYPEDQEILEDVMVENKQALEMANIYSNILSGMMDAFASIISNNLNIVMKFLTSVTIILALPTLVASVYGMNVHLPFQESPHAFALTMGISFLLAGMSVFIFIRRKFF
ncbi:Mg2 transporter protein CorA family protein [Candidatus Vecturithrix granuli]|uniref:Mg2 transporter protein CorA family protein n=1 Tax=Vecturithrix granuli TaxID=1499967 RepID=A0A081C7B3_VECG1|nr:Mg2 transporter protein CorA family protein [Candidatus Vecturithrix granuli]